MAFTICKRLLTSYGVLSLLQQNDVTRRADAAPSRLIWGLRNNLGLSLYLQFYIIKSVSLKADKIGFLSLTHVPSLPGGHPPFSGTPDSCFAWDGAVFPTQFTAGLPSAVSFIGQIEAMMSVLYSISFVFRLVLLAVPTTP